MLAMMRCQKYAELGLLLLSNVKVGDTVYLIGSRLCIFDKVKKCFVQNIEFIGQNDAMIHLICRHKTYDERLEVRNRQFNKLFFLSEQKAKAELQRRYIKT